MIAATRTPAPLPLPMGVRVCRRCGITYTGRKRQHGIAAVYCRDCRNQEMTP